MKYKQFIFEAYSFDEQTKTLELRYGMDDELRFKETFTFDFDFSGYDPQVLDRAFQNLFFMAGVTYYKRYIPPEIIVKAGQLDKASAEFFSKTYQRGLGEFWYMNKLDPKTPVTFPVNATELQVTESTGKGELVSVGGGKDSLVTVELLRGNFPDMATWSLGHKSQLKPLIDRIGLPHYWVEREWDKQLIELGKKDGLRGHVPISAIFACVGTVVAILAGKRDVVMSNEQSANEPTLVYQGVEINHQYSKSQEFEQDYQAQLQRCFGDTLRYYSFLRPLSELHIAEIFTQKAFEKYKDVFSSCNRAFTHDSDKMFWCGECPKCAFVFLALTPFVPREQLEQLFHGKNLLKDPNLEGMYKQLLGIDGDKPLECVGEIKESRAAMSLAQQQYPELTYEYELPEDYDYKAIGSDSMPENMRQFLLTHI